MYRYMKCMWFSWKNYDSFVKTVSCPARHSEFLNLLKCLYTYIYISAQKNEWENENDVFAYYLFVTVHLSLITRKPVVCHMWTIKAQISLRICAVWSAPLLFAA